MLISWLREDPENDHAFYLISGNWYIIVIGMAIATVFGEMFALHGP